ncbi:MAG: hypothetical protein WBA72_08515 [Ornithinimicrobium sp.]
MRTVVSALVLVLIGLSSVWLWNESTQPGEEAMEGIVLAEEPAQTADNAQHSASATGSGVEGSTAQQLRVQGATGDVLGALGRSIASQYAGIGEVAVDRAAEAAEVEATRRAEAEAEVQAEAERGPARTGSSGSGGPSSGSDGASPQPVSPPPVQLDDDADTNDADTNDDDDDDDGDDDNDDDDDDGDDNDDDDDGDD